MQKKYSMTFDGISTCIDKQIEVQRQLLEVEAQKKQALTAGDVESLDDLLKVEQPLVMHNAFLEKQREALLLEVNDFTGRQADGSLKLQARLDELQKTAIRLRRMVRVNMGISRARLRVIHSLLELSGYREPEIYTNEGFLKATSDL
jgi:flagellar biosynthesis/type III secretory pathway chaperone